MPEQRSPLKEFRHLEEKLKTVGLSPAERARHAQLKEIVSPEAPAPRPGFDVNAAADALRAALEPAGRRGPGRRSVEPEPPDLDAGAGSLDPGPAAFGAAPAWDPAAAGSHEQAGWDADAAQPPLDPAAAFDMNALPFDAGGPGDDQGGARDAGAPGAGPALEGAEAGYEPGLPTYDLGPAAFDAAALPPEPGPDGYQQASWDAGLAAAQPEGEPIEAELVEAEPIEVEPLGPGSPEAPAPGPDFFTPEPLAADFTGAQPLDAAAFGEAEPPAEPSGWPGSEAQPAARSEAEPAAEETDRAPAEEAFEPAPVGGPGAFQAEEAPAALELLPVVEQMETGAPADTGEAPPVPLASASEFLSYLEPATPRAEPPPAPSGDALDLDAVVVEELPPVEVDVEEIAEALDPPAPPPAPGAAPLPLGTVVPPSAPAAPAPDAGGPPPTFVAGQHRVVVHTLEGQVLRGTIADVDLDAPSLPLVTAAGAAPEPIAASRVKAIFFMLLPGGRPPAPEGHKVRVTFRDGRQVGGFSPDYHPQGVGFFMVPADSRTNTGRIWVYREAVRQVSVT